MNVTARSILNFFLISLGVAFLVYSFVFVYKRTASPGESSVVDTSNPSGSERQDVVNMAKSKTYEDVKKSASGGNVNPNISDKDVKDKLVKEKVINDKPQNHVVVFDGKSVSPNSVTIKQGDIVTFRNKSSGPINIVGDGWGSALDIKVNSAFSQGFDFKGTYKYSVSPANNISGTIVVE